jgi:copper chaperone CopZ
MKDVAQDQLSVVRIEGMHCHKCEQAVQRALVRLPGVHEVEVDFNSKQASVLHQRGSVGMKQIMDAVTQAGYKASGFSQSNAAADQAKHS